MKQSGFIAIVFVVGCAAGGVAAQLVVPPARAGTSPTRWEYQCMHAEDGGMTSTLNKLGAEGWDLAGIAGRERVYAGAGGTAGYTVCAKRALP